jgi:hypothetical protein
MEEGQATVAHPIEMAFTPPLEILIEVRGLKELK